MTIKDIIAARVQRGQYLRQGVGKPWWDGYYAGWCDAYKDLAEILEQHGFNMDAEVPVIPPRLQHIERA